MSLDLARQSLDEKAVREARLIAIYLPMHTATRLAIELLPRLRTQNSNAVLCCYGLYAPMNAAFLRTFGVANILGGEFEKGLAELADRLAIQVEYVKDSDHLATASESSTSLERLTFEVPDRAGLPPLAQYASLVMPGGAVRVVGSTEASRGCKHLCRHCPIVPVYNGVFRIVQRDVVLEDIRRQVAAGAQHISFGDPDFFNGIGHALQLMEMFHREFPAVTYDATVKIEHLRKHEQYLNTLKMTGCLFIISAVESVDDAVLTALEKGHTREDFLHVARKFRELGMILHPTFLPFTPWTTLEGYLDLLRVISEEDLTEHVAPIQLGIRLLIPAGSRMLELKDINTMVGSFDPQSLAYPWKNADPRVDALSDKIQQLAASADRKKQTRTQAFETIWHAAHQAAGLDSPALPDRGGANGTVPFLSEPWYCCAEPTSAQIISIGGAKPVPRPADVSADSFV